MKGLRMLILIVVALSISGVVAIVGDTPDMGRAQPGDTTQQEISSSSPPTFKRTPITDVRNLPKIDSPNYHEGKIPPPAYTALMQSSQAPRPGATLSDR